MKMKKLVCLGLVLALSLSVFGAMRVSGDATYEIVGFVYLDGGASGDATTANSYAFAAFNYTNVTGPNYTSTPPDNQPPNDWLYQNDIFDADPSLPAPNASYFQYDVGGPWDWEPCIPFDQDVLVVLETVRGTNGWAGVNYTTSTNATLDCFSVPQIFPDSQIRDIPEPVLADRGGAWINITWMGMAEDVGRANIVNYTVYRSATTGGPYNRIDNSSAQVAGADVWFNNTGITGNYCYRIGVNYQRGAMPTFYTTVGLSEPLCTGTVDTTPPIVQSVIPLAGDSGVARNANVQVTFNEPMNPLKTDVLYQDVGSPPQTFAFLSWNPTFMIGTWDPFSLWDTSVQITLNVSGAEDAAGNPMTAPYLWRFNITTVLWTATAVGPISATPTNVDNININYTWTGTPTSVKLYWTDNGGTTWNLAGTDATIDGNFAFTLPASGTYGFIAVADDEIDPPAGGTAPEATPYVLDITDPTVSDTTPQDGAPSVSLNINVVVVFDEPMNTSVNPTISQLAGTVPLGGYIPVGWSGGDTFTWTHSNWSPGEDITLEVSGAKDIAGNTMITRQWSFRTGMTADTTPPQILAVVIGPPSIEKGLTVMVIASLTDTATGGSNIDGANYSVDGGPTTAMTAQNPPFDNPTEVAIAFLSTAALSAASHNICVFGWDDVPNYNTTGRCATLTVTPALPPRITNVKLDNQDSKTVTPGTTVVLTALVDDTNTGNSWIADANWTKGAAAWSTSVDMFATDGLFNESSEAVNITIDTTGWADGTYNICVYASDVAGNNNVTGACASLRIFAAYETTPPKVSSTVPASDAKDVAVTTTITITFSEVMNRTSVEAAISLSDGLTATSFAWSDGGKTVVFTPSATLAEGKKYTVTIAASAKDLSGNGLDGDNDGTAEGSITDDYKFSFTTKAKEAQTDLTWLWILIIVIIIIILVILLLWWMMRKKPAEEEAKPAEEVKPEGAEPTEGEAGAAAVAPAAAAPAAAAPTTKTCMSCGREIKVEFELCPYCGAHQTKAEEAAEEPTPEETAEETKESGPTNCKNCGKEILPGFTICPYCGTSQ